MISSTMEMLIKHGYLILFFAVAAEQIGLPLPSTPLLVAAGALAGFHQMNVAQALALSVSASLVSDFVWFYFGERRGALIVQSLSKMSLQPEAYLTKAQAAYSRHGCGVLLISKFVPEVGTIIPAIAGLSKLALWKFSIVDTAAAVLWAGTYMSLGWIFRGQIESLLAVLDQLGIWMGAIVGAVLAGFILMKYWQRHRIYRVLRVARISPYELKREIDAGDRPIIVDLRDSSERQDGVIPGSIPLTEFRNASPSVPQSGIVMYCSGPNELASARAALKLRKLGVLRVHPLEGGFPRWRELGYPIEKLPGKRDRESMSADFIQPVNLVGSGPEV